MAAAMANAGRRLAAGRAAPRGGRIVASISGLLALLLGAECTIRAGVPLAVFDRSKGSQAS